MPRVEFFRTDRFDARPEVGDPQMAVEAPEGAQLIDLCDDVRAPVSFSCRSATCGTCLVRVLQGREYLEEPGADEVALLELLGLDDRHRLACRAEVQPGAGLVRLQCIGPDRREPEVD